jgi:acyl-CoA synthetase (AMP-forming)/AMP-acid ligase II
MKSGASNILKLLSVFNKNSNNIAITDIIKNRKITYKEFLNLSTKLTSYLRYKKKLKIGDKILINFENSLEFLVLIFSCLLGGFIAVPIEPNLPKNRKKLIKELIKPKIEIKNLNLKKINSKKISLKKFDVAPFLILFTSGTTGDPKGILLENDKYISSAMSYSKLCDYDSNSRIYHCLPMFYNAGMANLFFSSLSSGSNLIIGPKISPLNLISLIENLKVNKISSTHLTPEILNSICKIYNNRKIKKDELQNIQIISTASFLHENTVSNFEKIFNIRILNCYGITEAGGPLTLQNWEDTFYENSVGRHSKEIKFKILQNKFGDKILVKTPYMMMGYITYKNKLENIKLSKSYFDTGDIGKYKESQLFITGRRQDIIKKGGEILSLNFLDNICKKIKNIEECVHVNVEDINKGSKIYLFVKFKKILNLEMEIELLLASLKKKIRNIELPDRIFPVPDIPKLFNGKINKIKLKNIYL